jgi:hypothetical protein
MQPAAPGADCNGIGQVRFVTGRESRHFFVPDMHRIDLALAANGVGDAVEAVADNAVNVFDPGNGKDLGKLWRCPTAASISRRARV